MKTIKKALSKKNIKPIKKRATAPLYPDPDLPPVKEDFRKTFEWRIFKIMAEFIDGFHFLADFKKTVTVFGSTVLPETNPHYKAARKFGELMAKRGYTIITGGGPGIMEAANRGAFEAGGDSIGINIELPEGQRMNRYVNKPIGFNYFFTRKVMLSFSSDAYIFFPGGFGTLDEFFEMVTLAQTKKLGRKVPIIVVGRDYWEPLFKWLKEGVYGKYGAVKKADLDIINIVATAEEAAKLVSKLVAKNK
ncbi:MAG: TIGR00730 family Rossman fold protein [Patescibacteria group bacterium]|nr:TIGR00730 family Rossman fold protein [Patescibacteria group bacterium]